MRVRDWTPIIDRLMTTRQAADEFGVDPSTVRKWVQRGLLTVAGTSGRSNCYWRSDLLKAERTARRGRALAESS